jgi:hypothetical protein
MKSLLVIGALFLTNLTIGQVETKPQEIPGTEKESDTTRFQLKNMEVILVSKSDTIYAGPEEENRHNEAHWAGLDYGYNILTNGSNSASFPNYPYWENDPVHSIYFNFNFAEKKVKIIQEYVGITSGIGLNFNQFAFKNNYVLMDSIDTIVGIVSPQDFSKNKLRAAYLQIPIMLEFNTDKDNSKGVYLAAGVVGGVRLSSRVKRVGKVDGVEFKEKVKGDYALNTFKLDATARFGFDNFGAFVNYSLLPLFDTKKTTNVQPFTFGLTMNF